jgi:hypothetical protein
MEIGLAEYQEVAEQFRAFTEIRFKLLTYLPAGTATLAALISKNVPLDIQPIVAAFGFIVTLCLGAYNLRNDQHYDELVARAAQIERENVHSPHGAFSNRPQSWLKFGKKRRWVLRKGAGGRKDLVLEIRPVTVEHRWPIGMIYATACALWAAIFVRATFNDVGSSVMTTGAEAEASLIVFWVWLRLRAAHDRRRTHLRDQVIQIMSDLEKWASADSASVNKDLSTAIGQREPYFGIKKNKASARINHFTQKPHDLKDSRERSLLLAAVIDLPARWIEDVSSGRR